jgi:hypothetical protein
MSILDNAKGHFKERLAGGLKKITVDEWKTDIYYKTAYPDHNLVRARNQMALYRSLLLQEDDLQRIVVRKTW